jgi:hypothetical protein
MKLQSLLIAFVIPIMAALSIAAEEKAPPVIEKTTIKLLSGETLVGKVAGIKDDSVSLATDYGVVRIPVSKITEESRKKLNIPEETDVAKLKTRIGELEALVASLREENANLRKSGTTGSPPQATPSPKSALKPAPTAETGVTYKLSKSGKRHNSRCRYFSSAGEQCGPNEGEPCKVCGG